MIFSMASKDETNYKKIRQKNLILITFQVISEEKENLINHNFPKLI